MTAPELWPADLNQAEEGPGDGIQVLSGPGDRPGMTAGTPSHTQALVTSLTAGPARQHTPSGPQGQSSAPQHSSDGTFPSVLASFHSRG